MLPVVFVENGVILLVSTGRKVYQLMCLRLFSLLSLSADLSLLQLPQLRTWDVELLPCTGSLVDSGASDFIDLDVCARLNLRVIGQRSSIGMASSEIAVETLGKTTADLKLLDQTYPYLISES